MSAKQQQSPENALPQTIDRSETIPWYVTEDEGYLLLWGDDGNPDEEGREGFMWIDERGQPIPEGKRLRLMPAVDPQILLRKLSDYNRTVEEIHFDFVYDQVATWLIEDYAEFPETGYAYMTEGGDLIVCDDIYFNQMILNGDTDPNGPPKPTRNLPPARTSRSLPSLPPHTPTPASTPPVPPTLSVVQRPSPQAIETMKRTDMMKRIKALEGGSLPTPSAETYKYLKKDDCILLLKAYDAGDADEVTRAISAVEERVSADDAAKATALPTPPVVAYTAEPPTPPVVAEVVDSTPLAPASYPYPPPPRLSLGGLINAARGREWEWLTGTSAGPDSLSVEEIPHLTSQDKPIIRAIQECNTEAEVRDTVLHVFCKEDEAMANNVMNGLEYRGVRYPGLLDMIEELGLIRRY